MSTTPAALSSLRMLHRTGSLASRCSRLNLAASKCCMSVRSTARRSFSSSHAKEPLSSILSMEKDFTIPDIPDRIELHPGQRLVAIGDVHGDLDQLNKFLQVGGVADADGNWIGGDTICVQCGDILDRGDKELSCFRLLADLARQAHQHGGALAVLYGNHETMNVEGLFQYAWDQGNAEFEEEMGSTLDSVLTNRWRLQFAGNQPARWAAMEPGGILAQPFLTSLKVAVVVGKSVMVHGGLTMKHIDYYGGIEGMNKAARDWVQEAQHGDNNNLGQYETIEEVVQSAQARAMSISKSMPKCLGGKGGESSPVWLRLYSHPADKSPSNPLAQNALDTVLSELDAHRMVMGHTPQSCINAALHNKAWRIDVGASKGMMNGKIEVLEVIQKENGQEEVSVLTESNRIPANERQAS